VAITLYAHTFYDNTTSLVQEQYLLSFNLSYQNLLDQLNFHLIEEISITNTSSEITSLEEILGFARSRINQYQFLTGLIVAVNEYNLSAPPVNTLEVPDEVINIIRAAFKLQDDDANTIKYYKLREEDEADLAFL